jgi:hypothetical protein
MKTKKPKARMGRPPQGPESRVIPVLIRITATEKRVWTKLAKKAGMGLGPWLIQSKRDELNRGK